jgi:hypothetical protein
MGARHKLNTAYVWGCLVISSLFGIAAGSWSFFWVILVVTISGCYLAGDIRTQPAARPPQSGPDGKMNRPRAQHRRR